MPWTPEPKEFQEETVPEPVVPPELVNAPPRPGDISPYLDMPKWAASAFTMEPGYVNSALTVKPLEELIAMAYLRSVRATITGVGLSYLASYSGRHRCLAAGDRVLMADGSWRNIEDIRCGDIVLSPQHDETVVAAKVVATHSHFEEEVYDVVEPKLGNRRLYTCSKDHRIPLIGIVGLRVNKSWEKDKRRVVRAYKEYTAEHISKLNGALSSRVVTFSTPAVDFKRLDGTIDPYCLGLWLGDGHCSVTPGEPRLTSRYGTGETATHYGFGITTNDKEIVEAFDLAYPGEKNSIYEKHGTTAVTIRITSKGSFFSELKRLGLIGKKSGTKFIPIECMLSSIAYRTKLLAGLIDTDGYVPKANCTIEITTKSELLAKDILDLVCSLGGNGRITKIKKGIKEYDFEGEYYVVRFAFKAEKLGRLTAEVHVPRKKERLLKQIARYSTTGRNHANYDPRYVSIKCVRAEPQMVYGFTLDSQSHMFITNDWLTTLNSGKSVQATLMGYLWDPTFHKYFERRIVQSPQEFVAAMEGIITDDIKGAAIVIDEAGATMASSDWYEKWIKAITKTLQICGMLKPMILFVAPSRDYIVSGMRKLIVAEHYLERWDNDRTNMNVYHVKYSTMKHDYYYKKPVIRIAGQTIQLKRMIMHKPPDWFIERYKNITEPRKVDMMATFAADVKRSMVVKDDDKEPDYEGIVRDVFMKREVFLGRGKTKEGYPTVDQTSIEIHYKLRPKYAGHVKHMVERKIQEYMDEQRETVEIRDEKLASMEKVDQERRAEARRKALKTMPAGGSLEVSDVKNDADDAKEQMDEGLKRVLEEI